MNQETNGPQKIISLIPSATEIVCGLGLYDKLIGVSHECDFPIGVKGLPVLTAPKIDVSRTSLEVDRSVRSLVRNGLSIYSIDIKLLEQLKPDLIVTQDQCDVCAVSLAEVENAVCSLTLQNTKVCSLHPITIKSVEEDFLKVACSAGVKRAGEELVKVFRAGLSKIEERLRQSASVPRVLCVEWLDPLIVSVGWMPELIRVAKGAAPEFDQKMCTGGWNEIKNLNVEYIIIMPCGYKIEKTLQELSQGHLGKMLRCSPQAVAGKCFVCDGNAYFNRPGPRLVDSAEILSAILHPQEVPDWVSKHKGAFVEWPSK